MDSIRLATLLNYVFFGTVRKIGSGGRPDVGGKVVPFPLSASLY